MKYLCLRDCFVDKMYKKGVVYGLPESIGGEPKNFKCLEAKEQPAGEAPEKPAPAKATKPQVKVAETVKVAPKKAKK